MKAEVCKGVPYTQKSTQEGEEVERDFDKRKKIKWMEKEAAVKSKKRSIPWNKDI